MAMWVDSLDGLEVKVTGDFRRTQFRASQPAMEQLLRRHGARVVGQVRKTTDLLIRSDSPNWKYGEYGAREVRLARYQGNGRRSGVIDVDDLGDLLDGFRVWARDPASPPLEHRLWAPYRRARPTEFEDDEVAFLRDSSTMEKAFEGHSSTQNALAELVQHDGYAPLSPRGRIQFDLAWELGATILLAEVKSLSGARESSQMRMGLGQVLEYAWRLRDRLARPVRPVLAVEHEPSDLTWSSVCEASGVLLTWAPDFSSVGSAHQAANRIA